jgi:hypothetical protein
LGILKDHSTRTDNPAQSTIKREVSDERSDLIARMKRTMAYQDTVKEDPRDVRDRIISARECALLLEDFEFKDEFVYDGNAISIGPEKNGSDITLFVYAGTYTTPKTITLAQAKNYLAKRERKK